MRGFVKRIAEQGLTRDEARRARSHKQARLRPYVFRYQSPQRDFTLELRFRRSSVTRDEVAQALEQSLGEVRSSES